MIIVAKLRSGLIATTDASSATTLTEPQSTTSMPKVEYIIPGLTPMIMLTLGTQTAKTLALRSLFVISTLTLAETLPNSLEKCSFPRLPRLPSLSFRSSMMAVKDNVPPQLCLTSKMAPSDGTLAVRPLLATWGANGFPSESSTTVLRLTLMSMLMASKRDTTLTAQLLTSTSSLESMASKRRMESMRSLRPDSRTSSSRSTASLHSEDYKILVLFD